jgi:hypothetical protein
MGSACSAGGAPVCALVGAAMPPMNGKAAKEAMTASFAERLMIEPPGVESDGSL